MSDERDEWVRVESEDELRPGMAVQYRPWRPTGKLLTTVILQIEDAPSVCAECRTCRGIRHTEVRRGRWGCVVRCIHEGRLYRLRDLPAEETTTVATKRPVSVKAGR